MVEIIKGTETPVTKFFSSPLETNNERTLKVALEVFTQLANTLKQERDEAIELLIESSAYSNTVSQENTEKFLRNIGKWEEAK